MRIRKAINPAVVPRVSREACRACAVCLARQACQAKAIVIIDRGEQPFVDPSRCYGCRTCTTVCPHGAVV